MCFTFPEITISVIKITTTLMSRVEREINLIQLVKRKQWLLITEFLPVSKKDKNQVPNSRWLALSIQLRRTETFFDDESGDFVGFILLHSLQEPLIALTPVLTLRGPSQRTGHHPELPQWKLIPHCISHKNRWLCSLKKCKSIRMCNNIFRINGIWYTTFTSYNKLLLRQTYYKKRDETN